MKEGEALPSSGDYAIIDVSEASTSKGKILVLLEDQETAEQIAADLRHRGCHVTVQLVAEPSEPLILSAVPQVTT